ncbi:unnamed protein product [Mesocestoides corti]|nr:unnamed protein product [Mesocestoides corti]
MRRPSLRVSSAVFPSPVNCAHVRTSALAASRRGHQLGSAHVRASEASPLTGLTTHKLTPRRWSSRSPLATPEGYETLTHHRTCVNLPEISCNIVILAIIPQFERLDY